MPKNDKEKKQTSVKKTKTKKETIEKKNTTKSNKKQDKKKKTFKEVITSTKFLSIVFILLLMLVVFLSVMAYSMREANKDLKYKPKITLPLVQENDELGFSINALELAESKEYVFKITNYKKDKVIAVSIPYTLKIENGTDSIIEVYENSSKKDLMQNKRSLVLDNQEMPSETTKDIYYHVKMKKKGTLHAQDMINIVVSTGEAKQ